MIALLSQIGAVLMLIGCILMALPVIRVAPWGYTPLFEAALGVFLIGLIISLAGALGWVVGGAIALSLHFYPLSGG